MLSYKLFIGQFEKPLWEYAGTESCVLTRIPSVWRINKASFIGSETDFTMLLLPDEKEKASRYKQESDRQRFILGRAVLRILTGSYLNISADEVRFGFDQNKKPYLINPTSAHLYFNVSHSGDWILIAIDSSEVGIDVEQINASFDYQNILDFSFDEAEKQFVQEAENPDKNFYQLWTRKECLLKATGKGITDDLKLVPSLDGFHQNPTEITGANQDLKISTFKVDENHIASAAFCPVKTALDFFNFRL